MKDSTDAKEKTSRRSFAKSVATALVAAPVLSSLSSCAHKSDIGTTSPPEYLGANPQSLSMAVPLRFRFPRH